MVNISCTIGHEAVIGRGCVLNPTANISGGVELGSGVLVGTGAQILQYLSIGDNAQVGAGAVVTKNTYGPALPWLAFPRKNSRRRPTVDPFVATQDTRSRDTSESLAFIASRKFSMSDNNKAAMPKRPLYCTLKRLFDLSIGTVALVLLSPLLVMIGLLVALFLGTPIFFRQQRPGFNGRTFQPCRSFER